MLGILSTIIGCYLVIGSIVAFLGLIIESEESKNFEGIDYVCIALIGVFLWPTILFERLKES